MIKNVISVITFVTSGVCFIDLVRNKKQYRSLAYLILIVLIFLFIRPILVISNNYYEHLCNILAIVQLPLLIYGWMLGFEPLWHNDHHKEENNKHWVSILLFCLLLLFNCLVALGCHIFHNQLEQFFIVINAGNEQFGNINDRFMEKLSLMITDNHLYSFLKQNSLLVVVNIYRLLPLVLLCVSANNIRLFLVREKFKHYEYAILALVLTPFLFSIFPIFMKVVVYLFHEFDLPMPNI